MDFLMEGVHICSHETLIVGYQATFLAVMLMCGWFCVKFIPTKVQAKIFFRHFSKIEFYVKLKIILTKNNLIKSSLHFIKSCM